MKKYIVLALLTVFTLFFCFGVGSPQTVHAEGEITTDSTVLTTTAGELTETTTGELEGEVVAQLEAVKVWVLSLLSGGLGSSAVYLAIQWIGSKAKKKAKATLDALVSQNKISQEQADLYKTKADAAIDLATSQGQMFLDEIKAMHAENIALHGTIQAQEDAIKLRDERIAELMEEELSDSNGAD